MKEYLRQLAAQADNDLARACLVREYLQARILESLQDNGVFLRWAFVGNTALRFLFSVTLDRPEAARRLTFVHEPRKLPVVLSPEEITRMVEAGEPCILGDEVFHSPRGNAAAAVAQKERGAGRGVRILSSLP